MPDYLAQSYIQVYHRFRPRSIPQNASTFRRRNTALFKLKGDHMFIEIPASKKSLAMRRLVEGVGRNDADYIVCQKVDGRRVTCPFYKVWHNMLERCYSAKYQVKQPTYTGCSVVKEWLTFSNFRDWMTQEDWEDKQLDKDLIHRGNKVYGPDACCFIPSQLNSLLNDCAAQCGPQPQGVTLHKAIGKYQARISIKGKNKHLGYYHTVNLASAAYRAAKAKLILKAADEQDDPLIANGLRLHAKLL